MTVTACDQMNRTAELARVFGIDFYSVFSRGSQFRVESMMARLAHTQNYILVAPTRQQVLYILLYKFSSGCLVAMSFVHGSGNLTC